MVSMLPIIRVDNLEVIDALIHDLEGKGLAM